MKRSNKFDPCFKFIRPGFRAALLLAFAALLLVNPGIKATAQANPITHIVVLVKENRGFDHMFGKFPGANGATAGLISTGQVLSLHEASDTQSRDYCHTWNCNVYAQDGGLAPNAPPGRMDRWDVTIDGATFACNINGDYACYSQYLQTDIPNYWILASTFLLADNNYSSIHATSFPNHVYTVAASSYGIIGQAHLITNSSQGESGCNSDPDSTVNVMLADGSIVSPFPCFDFQSIVDLLDNHLNSQGQPDPISWTYYSPNASSYNPLNAINHLVNNTQLWSQHVKSETAFVTDAQSGNLSQVSYVVTDDPISEHPPWSICNGENWDVGVVNAILQSTGNGAQGQNTWDNTALFIYWDDNGGFYDHQPPPYLDNFGLGPRTPMLIVSPWADVTNHTNHVISTQYEPSSVLAFIETTLGLGNLGGRDVKANNVENAFDFTQSPIPFEPLTPRSCPVVSNSNSGINFPVQQVGTKSPARLVTITNYNPNQSLTVSSIGVTGSSFSYNVGTGSTACKTPPFNLGPANPNPQQCVMNVFFAPTASGPQTGTLTISAPGASPATLTGVGSLVGLTPNPLVFATVPISQQNTQSATLSNNGSTTLTGINIQVVGSDYSQTNGCGTSLNAGAKCTISVTFKPTAPGTRYAAINVTDSDASSPQVLNVTGFGEDLILMPTTLSFSTTAVGGTSAAQTVTLTNGSATTLENMAAFIQGSIEQTDTDFAVQSSGTTCGASLSSGSSCTYSIAFTPQGTGIRTGQLAVFNSEVASSPLYVTVSGTGQANPVPYIVDPLVPTAVAPGGAQFTLTVEGSGFVSGASVNWNGSALATTFVSGSKLTATVPAANIATAGAALITVSDPLPGGGTSNIAQFEVTAGGPPNPTKTDVVVGTSPLGIARGDFNKDGKLDLAIANNGSNTVSILLGNGNGTFTLKSSPGAGVQPTAIAVGDFNEDGNPDLAVTDYCSSTTNCGISGSVTILLGNGDGTFNTEASVPQTGPGPMAAIAGDFNQDGWLDLGTANFLENLGTVMMGNGNGTFNVESAGANTGQGPNSIAVADYNNDGVLDLAITSALDNVISVLPGQGDGTFTWTQGPTTPLNQPSAVVAADFNGDGNADLAVANLADSTISIFLGSGTGTFTAQASVSTGTGPNSLAVGDFNGDGKLDLASVNATAATLSIIPGNGDGTFSPNRMDFALDNANPSELAVGDFNSDGKIDFAVTNNASNTVSILLEPGGGGGQPSACIAPTSLTFPTTLINTTSATQGVTLTNCGNATLNLTSVTISGNFIISSNGCGTTLAPNANCTVQVAFMPTATGTLTGTLSFTDNAPGSPQAVPLTGVGTIVSLNPTSLNFGTVKAGTKSTKTVTLTNGSTHTKLNVSGVKITGTNASSFSQHNTCVGTGPILPGGTCTITVKFGPATTGSFTATLNISDNGGGSPQLVPLSGTGN